MKRLVITVAVLLALVVTASAIIEAYGEATSPKAPTSTLSGTPLDPGVAQQVEHRLKPEVAGAEPASGVTGGVPTEAQARTAVLIAAIAAIAAVAFALHLVYGWRPARDVADEMCPNCVTPWKCNGPHTLDRDAWPEGVGTW